MIVLPILALVLPLFLGTVNAVAGSNPLTQGSYYGGSAVPNILLVTAKEATERSEAEKTSIAPSRTASEVKTEPENKKGGTPSTAAGPLKPFVPSKEIEADQAVDFPNDI